MDIETLEIFQNNYVGDTDQKSCPFWPAETISNINEVITAVLNFLLFFYKKIWHTQNAQRARKAPKARKAQKRNQVKAQNGNKRRRIKNALQNI